MLKIKLFIRGHRNQRTYRIVVAEKKSKRDGKYIEDLGYYNPQTKEFKLDKAKLEVWEKKGAQQTDGIRKLLKNQIKQK